MVNSPSVAIGVAVGAAAVALWYRRKGTASSSRVLVAVSGTIQDGFELRKNIDYTEADGSKVKALLIGYGVVRGVKMFFDVKDAACREYDIANSPHRVNPAMVLTGNRQDANQYAVYLVDERACLVALLGEPRYLTMTPDAVRIELNDPKTSAEVASLARTIIATQGKTNSESCAVLAVVPCYRPKHFVPAPPMEVREDGTRLTSFRTSLAAFAGLKAGEAEPGTAAWNGAVAAALAAARASISSPQMLRSHLASSEAAAAADDDLFGTDPTTARISTRLSVDDFNALAEKAGLALRAE